jgi:zinc protease
LSRKSVRRLILVGALGVLVAVVGKSGAHAQGMELIDIPYEKFKLKNGLTVIVHEEHKAPIVAVNVWQEELCQRVLSFRPPN